MLVKLYLAHFFEKNGKSIGETLGTYIPLELPKSWFTLSFQILIDMSKTKWKYLL